MIIELELPSDASSSGRVKHKRGSLVPVTSPLFITGTDRSSGLEE